jgi:peptidoglycan/xylan/chitin deacetylase (PgdA/CDA1 family)
MLRRHLPRLASSLGASSLLVRFARRPGLLALAYHRVGALDGNNFDDELFSATPDDFRQQIRFLAAHFDVLSADRLVDAFRSGRLELTRPSALITFDDGYRDNCDVAMPILRDEGLSATFFVSAGYIDSPRLTWWDRVAYVMKQTRKPVLRLDYPSAATFRIQTTTKNAVIRDILRLYKRTPGIDQTRFFALLEHEAEVSVDAASLSRNLFMSWDDVRSLKRAGMEIGAHTYNHPVLARVPEDAQRDELSLSKERLELETAAAVRLMAYPVGGPDAFTVATKRLARETGYLAAFSYYGGFNRCSSTELFDLRRIAVERGESLQALECRVSMNNLFGGAIPR